MINTLLYVPVMQQRRSTDRPRCKGYSTICCSITGTYNKVFIVLTYNFSKEQYVLPEDDLRIETCRSLLDGLV